MHVYSTGLIDGADGGLQEKISPIMTVWPDRKMAESPLGVFISIQNNRLIRMDWWHVFGNLLSALGLDFCPELNSGLTGSNRGDAFMGENLGVFSPWCLFN